MADRMVWPPSLSRDWEWRRVTKCTHLWVFNLRLESNVIVTTSELKASVILLHYSSRMLVGQPLAMFRRNNPLCHLTIFLLVFHAVNHLQPFLASLSSLVVCQCNKLCATTASASSVLSSLLLWQLLHLYEYSMHFLLVSWLVKQFSP